MQMLLPPRKMLATCGALFAALAVSAPGAAAADPVPAGTPEVTPEYTQTLLSNEMDTSRWAFVTRKVIAYAQPKNQGSKVRKLTTRTPDRTNELVLALAERRYTDGTIWVQVRLPMRGSGKTGW